MHRGKLRASDGAQTLGRLEKCDAGWRGSGFTRIRDADGSSWESRKRLRQQPAKRL